MQTSTNFETLNAHAAGIDIGQEKIFVCTDGTRVVHFSTFTCDYHRCIAYLKQEGIERVAMEATGVYWIALYELLEQAGLEVCLVNPKEVKQVKGRKSDVKDCQWIQKLFSAGLIRQSYIPQGPFKELRMMVRERDDILQMGSSYLNKMQKALELMNIKLTQVLSQIHGVSGLKMIEAILAGERNTDQLLALCDKRIQLNKAEQVKKALEGNYNPSWLFLLEQNLHMYRQHEQHLRVIDKKIEELLEQINAEAIPIEHDAKPKPIRHHKPAIEQLHQHMLSLFGVNAETLPGLTDYTLLKLCAELGNDLSRFPSSRHFVSYCQLSPRSSQSGKSKHKIRQKNKSKAGQLFRECAQTLLKSKDSAIGGFMRRIRSRKGGPVAVKAGARKLATAFYNLVMQGVEYMEAGIRNYELMLRERELKQLSFLAKKYKIQMAVN